MKCPKCNDGNIKVFPTWNSNGEFIESIICQRCNGSNQIPDYEKEWIFWGEMMKIKRMRNGLTLRSEAIRLNIDVTILSKAERGIIDPREIVDDTVFLVI